MTLLRLNSGTALVLSVSLSPGSALSLAVSYSPKLLTHSNHFLYDLHDSLNEVNLNGVDGVYDKFIQF